MSNFAALNIDSLPYSGIFYTSVNAFIVIAGWSFQADQLTEKKMYCYNG